MDHNGFGARLQWIGERQCLLSVQQCVLAKNDLTGGRPPTGGMAYDHSNPLADSTCTRRIDQYPTRQSFCPNQYCTGCTRGGHGFCSDCNGSGSGGLKLHVMGPCLWQVTSSPGLLIEIILSGASHTFLN